MSDQTATETSPAYFPFKALTNMLDRMQSEGVPAVVDKSYVANLPWGYQNHFLAILRNYGLTDESGVPTETLKRMAQEPDSRPELIAAMLRQHYPTVVALDANATQGQLEDAFKAAGISGSTIRKAINFYLQAAEFAEIPVSRHFKTPRATSGNGRRATGTRSRKTTEGQQQTPPPPPPAPHSDLHPIIQGLLKELPPAGGTWTPAKREQWLGIVQATVDMLIAVEDDGRPSASHATPPRTDEE